MQQNVRARNDHFPLFSYVKVIRGNDVLTSQADTIFYRMIQRTNTVILAVLCRFLCDVKVELVNMQE